MNIQIFGKNKCFATKAAERFFKERKVNFQLIDLAKKGLSAKELDNALQSIGEIDLLFDEKSPLYEKLNIAYQTRSIDDKKELLLANPSLIKAPIVRDCKTKKCTLGSAETVWKSWF